MNPARSISPAVVSNHIEHLWIYIVAPIADAAFAIPVFKILQACLKSIEEQKPDAIYCLGDLVGYNIWANEVINEITKRDIPTIAGNYDFGIGKTSDDCGCAYKTGEEKVMGKVSISFTNSIVKEEEII